MRLVALTLAVMSILVAAPQSPPKPGQGATEYKIKKDGLKDVLSQIGFKPKELGKGVFEIQVPKGDDTIYIAVSMSSSLGKVWLTGSFGMLTDAEKKDAAFLMSLLEKNGEIQPTHFYVRKGRLNIGVPVDNRIASNQVLKKEVDGFADNVVKTKDFWQRHE